VETNLALLEEDQAAIKVAYAIYILYLAFIVLPLLPMLPIIGLIIAYIFQNDAKTYLKSHYQYLIRSFWMGILYFSIAILTFPLLVGIILVPLCFIWLLIRMVIGLKSLLHQEAIAKPKTWGF
jgi:uncharacterized membrane protein